MSSQPPLTNVVLLADDAALARATLTALVEEVDADAALLLLRSGEVAVSHLDEPLRSLETLGALVAANFASAREIARVLGDSRFEGQVQQGTARHIVTQAVGEGWILAVVFRQSTSLGLVRMLAARAAVELAPLHERARAWSAGSSPAELPGVRAAAARAVDRLFGEPT